MNSVTPAKIVVVYSTLALLGAACSAAAQAPYCAFEVTVHRADGDPSNVGVFAYQDSQRFKEVFTDATMQPALRKFVIRQRAARLSFELGARRGEMGVG